MVPYYSEAGITIYHGRAEDVLPSIGPVDLTVTSPPYDNLREYHGYSFDFETIAKELYRVTKRGGVVIWVVGDATVDGSETGTSFRQALYFKDVCGFNLHDTMVYEKTGTGAVGSNKSYWQSFEFMFVLSKGTPTTVSLIADHRNTSAGGLVTRGRIAASGQVKDEARRIVPQFSVRSNIWRVHSSKDDDGGTHPARFPETLASDHIRSWSNSGDTILDPMMGSNTTGKMARLNGCKFIGIEISEKYCEIAAKRLRQEVLSFEGAA